MPEEVIGMSTVPKALNRLAFSGGWAPASRDPSESALGLVPPRSSCKEGILWKKRSQACQPNGALQKVLIWLLLYIKHCPFGTLSWTPFNDLKQMQWKRMMSCLWDWWYLRYARDGGIWGGHLLGGSSGTANLGFLTGCSSSDSDSSSDESSSSESLGGRSPAVAFCKDIDIP